MAILTDVKIKKTHNSDLKKKGKKKKNKQKKKEACKKEVNTSHSACGILEHTL